MESLREEHTHLPTVSMNACVKTSMQPPQRPTKIEVVSLWLFHPHSSSQDRDMETDGSEAEEEAF